MRLNSQTLMGGKGMSNFAVYEKIFKGIEVKILKKAFLIPQCGTRLRTLYIKLKFMNIVDYESPEISYFSDLAKVVNFGQNRPFALSKMKPHVKTIA